MRRTHLVDVGGGDLTTPRRLAARRMLHNRHVACNLGNSIPRLLRTAGLDCTEVAVPKHARFGRINRFLSAEWGVALVLVAAAVLVAASGREQRLVGFYAVAVFASFLAATIACARLSYRDGRRVALVLNIVGAALIAIILGINATRLDGLIALLTSGGVAVYLFRIWVSRGRPKGVAVAGVQSPCHARRSLTKPVGSSRVDDYWRVRGRAVAENVRHVC